MNKLSVGQLEVDEWRPSKLRTCETTLGALEVCAARLWEDRRNLIS